MKKLVTLLLLLYSINLNAATIRGFVSDAETKKTLENVNIILAWPDSIPITQTITEKNGSFNLKTPKAGDYLLITSCMGYKTSTIEIKNIQDDVEVGNIELTAFSQLIDEVTIIAKGYTKIDRQIIFPPTHVLSHSFTGIEVLSKLMLTGLMVNSVTNTITSMNNRPVQLRINDVIATTDEILTINPQRIKKIEYIDLPGIKYGEAGTVINFILKKPEKGFSTGGNNQTAITSIFTNNLIYLKYNKKKSEFGINYNTTYQNLGDNFRNERITFLFPDENLQLIKNGIKAPHKSKRHNLSLSYNWNKEENTVFNVLLKNNYSHPDITSKQQIYDGINNKKFHSYLRTNDYSYTPTLDLYFQHALTDKQAIIANVVGSHISSDYKRVYQERLENNDLLSDYSYNTDGKKYSLLSEIIYENRLNKAVMLSTGIKYAQGYIENSYLEQNKTITNSMNTSSLYGYVQLQGSWNKLNYQVGTGYSRQYFNEGGSSYTKNSFRPQATISFAPNDDMTFRYNFYILPYTPSLSDLSDFRQWQNKYEVFVGNPSLKPYNSYTNILSLNFRKGRISLSPTLYYQFNQNSVMPTIQLMEEEGFHYLEYSNKNQKNFQHLQGRIYATIAIVKNRLNVTIIGALNRYINHGNAYTRTSTNYFGGYQLEGNYKNWSISGSFYQKSKMLSGETFFIYSPRIETAVRFRYKKFQYGLEAINPFLPEGNSPKQKLESEYIQKETSTYNRNYGNLVRLTIAWNLEFGQKYSSKQKRMENADYDAGIIK